MPNRPTRADQLAATIALVRSLEHAPDLQRFRSRLLGLQEIVPGHSISYNELDLQAGAATVLLGPADLRFDGDQEVFLRHVHEHPVVSHMQRTGDLRPRTLSDFLSETQLHDLQLYREFFSRLEVEDQIAFGLPAPPGLVLGLAISRRSRGFCTEDRQLLAAVAPLAAQAYLLAQGRERAARIINATGTPPGPARTIAVIDRSAIILARPEQAAELIERYLGEPLTVGRPLPAVLDRYVAHQRQITQNRTALSQAPAPTQISGETARLLVRLIPAADPSDDRDLLMLEECAEPLATQRIAQAGLTERQIDVARMLVDGHTNAQIARSLYLSPSTVKRHLEGIYSKLAVSNRAAAAASLVRQT